MLGTLFPIVYAVAGVTLLLQAFRMMRLAGGPAGSTMDRRAANRTGLRTVHPELLDENGEVTTEELWAVSFSELKSAASPEN